MKKFLLLFLAILLVQSTTLAQQGWFEQTSGTTNHLNSVYFVDADNGWAVGDSGTILNTNNGGDIWNNHTNSITENLSSVQFVDINNGWIVNGGLLRTTNAGQTWVAMVGDTVNVNVAFFIDSDTGWIADCCRIYKTIDGGINWELQLHVSIPIGGFNHILFIDSNFGWAFGWVTGNYKTSDGGENWNQIGGAPRPADIFFISNSIGWLVKNLNTREAHKTTDGGITWQLQFDYPPDYQLGPICFIGENYGWIGIRNQTNSTSHILYTGDGGVNWTEQNCGNVGKINSIYFVDSNTGWAICEDGAILKTTTGGVVSVEQELDGIPTSFSLSQNYPNPFNPSTKIKYSVPQTSDVVINVFDILGNEIETLVNEQRNTGTYEITWYAENLPSGFYFYRLQAGNFVEIKKMILMK